MANSECGRGKFEFGMREQRWKAWKQGGQETGMLTQLRIERKGLGGQEACD
jgi:hypothetical protein